MFVPLKQALIGAADAATENYSRGGVEYIGIPTGIREIDVMTGGFRKKDVYLIGGRTGLGKSSLALSMAQNASAFGARVAYVTLEMSAQVLALRYMAAITGINSMKIERGRMTAMEMTTIQNLARDSADLDFYIDDSTHTSFSIRKALEEADPKFDIVFIDYLTLLRDEKGDTEADRLGKISANFKEMATVLDIPIVILVQLNRETEKNENGQPSLAHIRGSGAPEQDAAGIFLIKRPHVYAMLNKGVQAVSCEDDAEIHVAKNRHGPTGAVRAKFYPQQMKWEGHT